MSTTEREEVAGEVNLGCSGCAERDSEIERLLELNRELNLRRLSVRTPSILIAGWLLMTGMTFALMIYCIDAANGGPAWMQYISIGTFVSIFIVQFGLVPALLLIHGGPRLYRVLVGCGTTIAMLVAWVLTATVQSDIEDIWDELFESVCVLPAAVVVCLLPIFVMKLFGRWRLVAAGGETRPSDPSISSILSVTTLIAIAIACLTNLDAEDFLGTGGASEKTFLFLYFLALPGLTVGATLAASCYCALGQNRSILKVALGFVVIIMLLAGVAPASLSALAVWMIETETVDADFIRLMYFHTLGPLFVGTFFGLIAAYWLRLAGYKLCTRGEARLRHEAHRAEPS